MFIHRRRLGGIHLIHLQAHIRRRRRHRHRRHPRRLLIPECIAPPKLATRSRFVANFGWSRALIRAHFIFGEPREGI